MNVCMDSIVKAALISCKLSELKFGDVAVIAQASVVVIHFLTLVKFIEGKFCGGKMPQPVESSGNTMVVRFKSDNTLTSKGFSATYTKSSLPPVTPRPTTPKPTTPRPTTQTTQPPTTSGKHSLQTSLFIFFLLYT